MSAPVLLQQSHPTHACGGIVRCIYTKNAGSMLKAVALAIDLSAQHFSCQHIQSICCVLAGSQRVDMQLLEVALHLDAEGHKQVCAADGQRQPAR